MTATLERQELAPKPKNTKRPEHSRNRLRRAIRAANIRPFTDHSVDQYQAAFQRQFIADKYPRISMVQTWQHRIKKLLGNICFLVSMLGICSVAYWAINPPESRSLPIITLCAAVLLLRLWVKLFFSHHEVQAYAAVERADRDVRLDRGELQWKEVELLVDEETGTAVMPTVPHYVNVPGKAIRDAVRIKKACADAEFGVAYFDRDPFLFAQRRSRRGTILEKFYIHCWDERGFVG